MSINTWVDDRVKNAIDYAVPKIQVMLETVVEAETAKLFTKIDAHTTAILGTLTTDVAGLAKSGVADIEKVGGAMADDVTSAGTAMLNTLRGLIPGL